MSISAIASHLRTRKQAIAAAWVASIKDLPGLEAIPIGALVDHLPEVLEGLAAWVEGEIDTADARFVALADGHALQRLGFGVEMAVLTVEYGRLRDVLMNDLLLVDSSPSVRKDLVRLDEGLDRAVLLSIQRYVAHRDWLRERFIAVLGHDLRGPLHAATLAVQRTCANVKLDPDDARRLAIANDSLTRMGAMVSDVLDFARGHLGSGVPILPASNDMTEILRAVVDEAKLSAPQRRIELHATGDLRGHFDRARVHQALGNLLGNAIAHGGDPIVVDAKEEDGRQAIVVSISNKTVVPMPPHIVANLFKPFAHASDDRNASLGLGLYIAHQIVTAHSGTIELDTAHGTTRFETRWPRTPRYEMPPRESLA